MPLKAAIVTSGGGSSAPDLPLPRVAPCTGDERPLLFPDTLTGPNAPPLGLAVSGGSDSMAMLHLIASAAAGQGQRIEVVTVDHRLRPEAADEAEFVARSCQALGLHHQTLIWQDHPAQGNLMQAASRARCRLMAEWARGRGLSRIALAHTADDQAECFLMGLSRAAGLDGLTGMRAEWQEEGITFLRPLLAASREELRDALRGQGLSWCEDPSNQNPRYLRARLRALRSLLEPAGIGLDQLRATIGHLAETQAFLRDELAASFQRIGQEEAGALRLDAPAFAALHPEMRRRLVIAAIRWIGAARHAPRSAMVATVLERLSADSDATLGGCRFRLRRRELLISREMRNIGGPVPAGSLWDQRWQLQGPARACDQIAALGAEGLALCPGARESGISREALIASPALWREGRLIAAPLAGFGAQDFRASLAQPFAMFVLSH